MELEVKAWLFDILQAIQVIDMCIAPGTTYSSFERDRRTQLAVERSIEKIGQRNGASMGCVLGAHGAIPNADPPRT